ncbi:MAG: 3D domain-containing protein [Blastocatellia bacterium]|nr:3D domain-containing protein [Blastocatellia bacterium]MBO0799381.1 3D domain-containing protein [Blastocatellia bacterium]
MSRSLYPVLSTVCLLQILLMLQVGVAGQTPTKIANLDHESGTETNVKSEVTNMIASFKGFRIVMLPSSFDKTRPRRVVLAPAVSLKYPSLNLMVVADESRLSELHFPIPTMSIIGNPTVFSATAYSLNGITRSGHYVRRGVIAADPRIIPLGSVVQITAGKYSGVYTVLDTGRVIKGRIVDLWMPSYREAVDFGRQQVQIRILRRGYRKNSLAKTD